ncbi:hypothetical protein N0V82_009545 [Gnomoniopsis sp. IMI 355080]|nr:hypothetical protein N0V82_009545 [Gnomoniopsis sp. IMI 355080]
MTILIEAGPSAPDELRINVPAMFGSTQGTIYDWNFTTIEQPNVDDRELDLSRAKVLGGSSAMNYMVWNRASTAEYDAWESLGNPGWNWDSILAGMVKSENFTGVNSSDYGFIGRGVEGPVANVVSRYRTEQLLAWVPTLGELGIAHNLESLGGEPLGAMLQPGSYNPDNYTRSYSANAYIPRAGSNLHILLSTRVAKVNFKPQTVKKSLQRGPQDDLIATGVTLQDGTVIYAKKEVILSAGAIQSPGLLELSGIGKTSVLDAAGIEPILDLPGVGENFQDHIGVPITYQLKPGYHSLDILKYNTTYAAEQLALWEASKVFRYDQSFNAIAFLNWQQITGGNDSQLVALAHEALGNSSNVIDQTKLSFLSNYSVPQMELLLGDGSLGYLYPAVGDPLYGADFVSFIAIFMRPLSRGSVHIVSSDITQAPRIDPQYLSSQYDVQSMVEATKYLRNRVASTEPLSQFLLSEYQPGLETVSTDEEWAAYTREALFSIYHYSGTCAMLPKKDGGVVGPRLKVYGTENLRVVDVSITPVLIGSHTQTVAYGIAEVAAEMIIEDSQAN